MSYFQIIAIIIGLIFSIIILYFRHEIMLFNKDIFGTLEYLSKKFDIKWQSWTECNGNTSIESSTYKSFWFDDIFFQFKITREGKFSIKAIKKLDYIHMFSKEIFSLNKNFSQRDTKLFTNYKSKNEINFLELSEFKKLILQQVN